MPETNITRGLILYDADCQLCRTFAARFAPMLIRRGFTLAPQDPAKQTPEMRLVVEEGPTLGGADALIHIARFIWWARPLRWIANLPGGRAILRRCYRWIAARRHCANGLCELNQLPAWPGWTPLLILPAVAVRATWQRPSWLFMWALAIAIFAACKWLTWWDAVARLPRLPLARSAFYLFLWPGMDAMSFLDVNRHSRKPALAEWLFALGKTLGGALLIWRVARLVPGAHPLVAGWIGMFGLIFLFHFGAFHLAALWWQARGIPARPLMKNPIAARSLGEFWSIRWNRGFNDLVHAHLFVPARRQFGATAATLIAFLASGLVHELVISLPARGGYGLPTLYFLLQGLGILAEHSRFGQLAGLRRGIRGRLFTLTVTGAPAYGLFHPAFVMQVIIPFLHIIKAL